MGQRICNQSPLIAYMCMICCASGRITAVYCVVVNMDRLDDTDERILAELAEHARATYAEIGERVNLSAPAVKRRVDRLLDSGGIRGFTTVVDRSALGWTTEAYVQVFRHGTIAPDELRKAWIDIPEVVSAATVTGTADAMLHVLARDMRHLEEALERIRSAADVERSESIVVLTNVIDRRRGVSSKNGMVAHIPSMPSCRKPHVSTSVDIVIVGGGLSAARTAEQLRRSEYAGTITIVSDEDHLPYDRPPLSKEVLRAEVDDVTLKPAEFYEENDITVVLGNGARSVDTAAQTVTLADGTDLGYDELIIATGLVPKTIPSFPDLEGIRVLRSIEESMALREQAGSARPGGAVGGGVR